MGREKNIRKRENFKGREGGRDKGEGGKGRKEMREGMKGGGERKKKITIQFVCQVIYIRIIPTQISKINDTKCA